MSILKTMGYFLKVEYENGKNMEGYGKTEGYGKIWKN